MRGCYPAGGNTNNGPDTDRPDGSAHGNQVVVGCTEDRDAEELIARPAVGCLVGEVHVAQRPDAAAHDKQQVVRRRLGV
ncbi:MAG: hypothetical protein LC808_44195 [Actinobacteria bacterium]|nr:hypothetical protein [Actinomycetota bacterium]